MVRKYKNVHEKNRKKFLCYSIFLFVFLPFCQSWKIKNLRITIYAYVFQ